MRTKRGREKKQQRNAFGRLGIKRSCERNQKKVERGKEKNAKGKKTSQKAYDEYMLKEPHALQAGAAIVLNLFAVTTDEFL